MPPTCSIVMHTTSGNTRREDSVPVTWEKFKKIFYDKYFSRSVRLQKEMEFIRLVQGNKIVVEYEAKFLRLSQFASSLVATEEDWVRRFMEGLRSRIKQAILPFELKTYGEVVSKALLVERGLNEAQ